MKSWTVVETDEFLDALGRLPSTPVVRDVIAELFDRLEQTAGEGERVENSDCWVIKSAPQKGHKHPGIRLIYRLERETRQAVMLDAELFTEPLVPSRPVQDVRV